MMRAYLSGTPECKFGLNDKLVLDKSERGADDAVELDDCQFHQCVRLGKFDTDRSITFIPPDGEFELMKSVLSISSVDLSDVPLFRYRSTTNVNLPLKVQAIVVEQGKSKVDYTVAVKANFSSKLSATELVIKIPTPLNTTKVDVKVPTGKGKYVPAENVIIWK